MKKVEIAVLTVLLFYVVFTSNVFTQSVDNFIASTWFKNSIDAEDITAQYDKAISSSNRRNKVKVMIVPGHDDDNAGAYYFGTREADMNIIVGEKLFNLLKKEKGVNVFLTRNRNGYNRRFAQYLDKEEDDIIEFYEKHKAKMKKLVDRGKVDSYINIHHNTAKPEIANILYGINKYANEKDYDIVIHIHFNDYPGRTGRSGKYNGFSIYIPEEQYSNAKASMAFAKKLRDQLAWLFPESNNQKETGIVEDQELIAIGANNTADPITTLVEYGYIYESQFHNEVRGLVLEELAYQTYLGLMNFLEEEDLEKEGFRQLTDWQWKGRLSPGDKGVDVLALQYFLRKEGFYPTNGDLNNCPINGNFGGCTQGALKEYQKEAGIEPSGHFGQLTLESILTQN